MWNSEKAYLVESELGLCASKMPNIFFKAVDISKIKKGHNVI